MGAPAPRVSSLDECVSNLDIPIPISVFGPLATYGRGARGAARASIPRTRPPPGRPGDPLSRPTRSPRILALLGLGALPLSAVAAIELGTVDGFVTLLGTSTITNYYGPQDLGDVNGDGFDDMGESNGNGFCVYYGSADGLSDANSDCVALGYLARGLKGIGDHNGDGYADLMVIDDQSYHEVVEFYEGGPDGIATTPFATTTPRKLGASSGIGDVVAGDLDQDGYDDVLVQGAYWTKVMWGPLSFDAVGNATGTSWTSNANSLYAPVRLAEGDFDYNQDGYPDLIFKSGNTSIGIHAGSAAQAISTTPDVTLTLPSGGVSSVYTGDFDGNGWDDIIVHNGANRVFVAYNQGGGVFTWSDQRATGINFAYGNGQTYQAMDLNDDGYDDIVRFAHSNLGYQVGWGGPDGLAETNEFFTKPDGVGAGTWGTGVGVGDFDGDGDTEAVVRSGDSVYWSVGGGTVDTDGDGVCDATDVVDTDSDGIADDCDAFPADASESVDTDGDGVGDNSDAFPSDPSESADTDGDGVGDNADAFPDDATESADTDGDGVGDNSDAFPTDATESADSDGDGFGDNADICPGGDDNLDADLDGTPDDCDACPLDVYNDSDGDGSCDGDDVCPLDADDDADGDGICGDVDACPADADNDADADGVCGDVDACPNDAANDADGDGVCGDIDTCDGGDDTMDADLDGTADYCDFCPFDDANDADLDGICGDVDDCPLDADNDIDGDGVCGDVDLCPLDYDDDIDGDAVCDSDDPCPDDPENDADDDGTCESDDNCPTVANAGQEDADGDGIGDACEPDDDGDGVIDDDDNCPMDDNADQVDTDGDGAGDACDADDDGDGVLDGEDACLGTPAGEVVLDNGCSLDETCPCDGDWKNHGAYEKCVSMALKDLRKAGLISGSDARDLRDASEDNACGNTRRGRGHHDRDHREDYEDASGHDCHDRGHRHDKRRHR